MIRPSRPPRNHFSTGLRAGVAVIAFVAAVAASAVSAPASPAPASQSSSGSADAVRAASAPVTAQHTVTLVTGDLVLLDKLADGTETATVRPPADRLSTSFATRQVGGQLYVVPSDANALLAAGTLDPELFNVSQLVADGYDDTHSTSLPLIVQYPAATAKAKTSGAPPGTSHRFTLESINAQSVRENKAQARAFWTSLSGAGSGSVSKVWLDRKVATTLTESVPQIGAPSAWQAGYDGSGVTVAVLDTGIDTTHPDLDGGKVADAANFSADTDTLDHFGHGTHVASIVAGTGEGAPANRRGVAPGASLLNAKVLDRNGSGSYDSIIEGLEWAAAHGAKVANLSIGTHTPTDGDDPLVQAIDRISLSSGMLIVAAADNIGPGDSTITSPGWANEALTVGAVDKQDKLASFSSRGPRLGDYGIKPDITAPGVDIVAARADGTTLGPIVDGVYQTLSGTSMAAPHVAGAAAIIAQEFPAATNQQLKDRLISTAKTSATQTVYQQGGGRVDLVRAHAQQVYASPGTLNLGYFSFPHTDQKPVTKTVTYTNDGSTELTLDLSLQLSGKEHGPAPAGMFTLSQPTVTVPAGGTASVTVTVDPAAGQLDLYGGYLVATSGDTVVHTSVGAYLEPAMYNLTVSGIARDGRPAAVISWAELWSLDTGAFTAKYFSATNSTVTFRVRPGTYNLAGYIGTADAANTYALEAATVAKPELEITGDTSITLDARAAKQLIVDTQKPTAPASFTLSYHRDMGELNFHSSFTLGAPISRGYASPTATVTKGHFEFYSKWDLVAPRLQAEVTRPTSLPLDPQPMTNALPVDGKHTMPVVDVGLGKPEDYAGRDVRGKIALISRGETTFFEKIANATRAGAWGAIIFNNRPGLLLASAGNPGEVSIRAFTIDQQPGLMLVDMLKSGPVQMQVSGTSVSPYMYDLLLPEKQRIGNDLHYTIDRNNTAEINTSYDADRAGLGTDVRHISRPWPTFSAAVARDVPTPSRRTYYVSANDTYWWHVAWANSPFNGEFHSSYVQYQPRSQLSEHWFGRVSRPGFSPLVDTTVSREGDEFSLALFPQSDSGGHHGWPAAGDTNSTKLYAGDTLLADRSTVLFDTVPASPQPATYRLVQQGTRATSWSTYSIETSTTWTFHSSRPAAGAQEHPALLQVDYDLPLDSMNRAPDKTNYTFSIGVGHVPGVEGPATREIQAWASFDDGQSWRQVALVANGNGRMLASIQHPAADRTSGAVSLRVKATDVAGNRIDQMLIRAYGLKAKR